MQLKKIRKEKKISLRKLSELTGIPKSSLHDMESGKKIPKESELEVIAEALGVTQKEVLGIG